MSNPVAAVGAFVNRKFSINRNTGQPRIRRFSIGEPSATGEFKSVPSRGRGKYGCPMSSTLPFHRTADDDGLLQRRAPRSTGSSELLTSKPYRPAENPPAACPGHVREAAQADIRGLIQRALAPRRSRPFSILYRRRLVYRARRRVWLLRGAREVGKPRSGRPRGTIHPHLTSYYV